MIIAVILSSLLVQLGSSLPFLTNQTCADLQGDLRTRVEIDPHGDTFFIFRPPPKIVAVVGSTPCISASADRGNLNQVAFVRNFKEVFDGLYFREGVSEEYVVGCRFDDNDTIHYYLCIVNVTYAHAGEVITLAGGSSERRATTQIIVIDKKLECSYINSQISTPISTCGENSYSGWPKIVCSIHYSGSDPPTLELNGHPVDNVSLWIMDADSTQCLITNVGIAMKRTAHYLMRIDEELLDTIGYTVKVVHNTSLEDLPASADLIWHFPENSDNTKDSLKWIAGIIIGVIIVVVVAVVLVLCDKYKSKRAVVVKETPGSSRPPIVKTYTCVSEMTSVKECVLAAEESGQIKGITVVGDKIFVAKSPKNDDEVQSPVRIVHDVIGVYEAKTFKKQRDIDLPELLVVKDITGCSEMRKIYIIDSTTECIFTMDALDSVEQSVSSYEPWPLKNDENSGQRFVPLKLSIMRRDKRNSLLVTMCIFEFERPEKWQVFEFSSDGIRLRVIELREGILIGKPIHCVPLCDEGFVVCGVYHPKRDTSGGVCIVNEEGRVKAYASAGPRAIKQSNYSITIDERNRRIFVADITNHRILVYSFGLEVLFQISCPCHLKLHIRCCMPNCSFNRKYLCYDPIRERLLVGDSSGQLTVYKFRATDRNVQTSSVEMKILLPAINV